MRGSWSPRMAKQTGHSEPPRGPAMSPEAIDLRLRELAQLYRLWGSLRTGRWIGRDEGGEVRES